MISTASRQQIDEDWCSKTEVGWCENIDGNTGTHPGVGRSEGGRDPGCQRPGADVEVGVHCGNIIQPLVHVCLVLVLVEFVCFSWLAGDPSHRRTRHHGGCLDMTGDIQGPQPDQA